MHVPNKPEISQFLERENILWGMEMELTANDYKEAGNKKFSSKNFQSAIQDYTKAIGTFSLCVNFF
jgi:hypothetical protein